EKDFYPGRSGAGRRRSLGSKRRAIAAARDHAHRAAATRPQRFRTRADPGARGFRSRAGLPASQPSRRGDRHRPRGPAGIPVRGEAAGDTQGWRGSVHPGRDDSLRQERRRRHRLGARHLSRREGQAAGRIRSGERLREV
ncbi:MAG: FIG00983574: hypothetical protein, partial [uncultured Thermomicrobiales bacterium]